MEELGLATAYLMPRFKGDGSYLDPGSYRLLVISSVVAKVFEKVTYLQAYPGLV